MKYYKINPTGNITLIVESPVPRERQRDTAVMLMAHDKDAEQVGFIEAPSDGRCALRLQMMGGEFCGNASISCAALLAEKNDVAGSSFTFEISGIDEPINVNVHKETDRTYTGTVSMPLPERMEMHRFGGNELPTVHFPGISHIISEGTVKRCEAEKSIADWCAELNAEALGVMFIDGEKLTPLVYVASTGTAVWEHSCASGSTAAAAFFAAKKGGDCAFRFAQPGGTIGVAAKVSGGRVSELILEGHAEIIGEYLI